MSSRTYFGMKNVFNNNLKVDTLRLRFSAARRLAVWRIFSWHFGDKILCDEIRVHNGIDIEKPTGLVNTLQS